MILPSSGSPASLSCSLIAASRAPSKTGVATWMPRACAAQPRCVSSIWPMFIRLGTPSGLSTISTGVPPRHLVADADLALLGDRDADHLVDAGKKLVVVLAAEDRHVDDLPVLA